MFTRCFLNLGRQLLTPFNWIPSPSLVPTKSFFDHPCKVEFLEKPKVEPNQCQKIVNNVKKMLNERSEGRLFAIVHLCGKQFKVTDGDIVVIEGYWAPTIGDKIRLEKVLSVGGERFTVAGRPLMKRGLVDVQATIVEKTIAHPRTTFKKKRRKQYMRIKWHRSAQTLLRINSIKINNDILQNETV